MSGTCQRSVPSHSLLLAHPSPSAQRLSPCCCPDLMVRTAKSCPAPRNGCDRDPKSGVPTHDTEICDLCQGHGDKGGGGKVFSSDPMGNSLLLIPNDLLKHPLFLLAQEKGLAFDQPVTHHLQPRLFTTGESYFCVWKGRKIGLLITGRVGRMENKPPTGREDGWAAPLAPHSKGAAGRGCEGETDVSHRWLSARMGIEQLQRCSACWIRGWERGSVTCGVQAWH